jgi:hypothetical protein
MRNDERNGFAETSGSKYPYPENPIRRAASSPHRRTTRMIIIL